MKRMPPKVDNAPGLTWRPRKNGWEARWQARTDKVEDGFRPKTHRVWIGDDPTPPEAALISDQCLRLQNEMKAFGAGNLSIIKEFDGTLASLIECYQTDADSSFHRKRFAVRQNQSTLLKRIIEEHGHEDLSAIKARSLVAWHKHWSADGKMLATSHAIFGQLRVVFSFGATILEDAQCERLCSVKSRMRFPLPEARTERMTAAQAIAVRHKAHEHGLRSIALAQALQFELMLRQKDVIGEWVPIEEPGASDVHNHGQKWIMGVRWSEIDQNLVLKHITSKRQKAIEVNLQLAPMVMEELALLAGVAPADLTRDKLPASGPVILTPAGIPYRASYFRRQWRVLATAAKLPANVLNMDSRAGGITEAVAAGADLENIRHAATHSDIAMTQKYSRGSTEKIAGVMQLRADHRNKPKTG